MLFLLLLLLLLLLLAVVVAVVLRCHVFAWMYVRAPCVYDYREDIFNLCVSSHVCLRYFLGGDERKSDSGPLIQRTRHRRLRFQLPR